MGIQQMMLAGGAGPDEVATGGNVIVDSGPGSMRYHYFYGNGTFTTLPNWSGQANIIIVGGGGHGLGHGPGLLRIPFEESKNVENIFSEINFRKNFVDFSKMSIYFFLFETKLIKFSIYLQNGV